MPLPAPYWLQPDPKRGTAPTLESLPVKIDFMSLSLSDLDEQFEFFVMNSNGSQGAADTAIDSNTGELAIWREEPDGTLVEIDSMTTSNGRLIIGGGVVRFIALKAQMDAADYPAEVFYTLALRDAVPRTRIKAAGKIFLPDRLATAERGE